MGKVIDVMSLYPKDMNIYGDSGNVLVVLRRLALYGYEPRLHAYKSGRRMGPRRVDSDPSVGGGQDTGRRKSPATCSSGPAGCATWPRTVRRC